MRIATFFRTVQYIVHERIHAGRAHFRILLQIELRIEERMRIATSFRTVQYIVHERIDAGRAYFRICSR